MRNSKPFILLLGGSAIIFLITLVACILLNIWIKPFPVWVVFVLPFFCGLATYLIFYYLVKNLIHDRLTILYRSIRKGKTAAYEKQKFKITDDLISDAERETANWADERNNEIAMLKEQEAFRREFLGNLAHELKTPVFTIQGYLHTLLEGGLEDDSVNRIFLERATKGTDRMVSILEDLDAITKMEVNELKPDMKPFDIVDALKDILDAFEMKAQQKLIRMQFNKNYSPVFVKGDKAKISQVITNLIGNSIAYNTENGVTKVRINQIGEIVTVEIADDGPGIDPVDMKRIFERFYRVEKSRNRNEGGSGLGLAIAKHIIEAHGHRITVRSTVGVGSTFSFSLDAAKSSDKTRV